MEKIFIGGPMDTPDYQNVFGNTALLIQAAGYEVLNPAAVIPKDADRATALRICYSMIDAADGAYFLAGWERRPGARLEHDYCEYVGKRIFDQWPFPRKTRQ